jgi:hypothetical protein
MADELWHVVYHGIVAGEDLHGRCAACEYDGPTDDFCVWWRRDRHKVLCNQCSRDVAATMRHEGWALEVR